MMTPAMARCLPWKLDRASLLRFWSAAGHYHGWPGCHQIGDMLGLRHAGDRPSDSQGILGASPTCRGPDSGVVRCHGQGALGESGRDKAAVRQHRRFRGRQPGHLRSRRQQISADRPRVVCLRPRAREVHRHSFRIRPHRSRDRIMAKKMIRPIRSEADYDAALEEIEQYFENEPKSGTPEADRFDLLALIIEDYERKRWPIEPPDTIDAIRYRMETGGYTQADLGRLLGSRQRASDVLTRKRPLTMRMAWRLHREWGIPAEALIAPPRSRGRRSAA